MRTTNRLSWLGFVLLIIAALGLSACGGGAASSGAASTSVPAASSNGGTAATAAPAAGPECESPPPAAMPPREELPDPRLRLLELATEVMRTRSRKLIIEYLRLRRAI